MNTNIIVHWIEIGDAVAEMCCDEVDEVGFHLDQRGVKTRNRNDDPIINK